jgi:hypothetical protein
LSFRRIKGKSRKFYGCTDAAVIALGRENECDIFEIGRKLREGLDAW